MRSSAVYSIAAAGLMSFVIPSPLAAAGFQLAHVTVPTPLGAGKFHMYVRVTGPLPMASVLEAPASWHITARAPEKPLLVETVASPPVWNPSTRRVELIFNDATLSDPSTYGWKILFTGDDLNLIVESEDAPADGFKAAKGKNDADLYASGTWLAGRGSAPIYAFDTKLNWTNEIGATPWDAGILFAASMNSDAKLPVDSSTFDLDAISLAGAARYWGWAPIAVDFQPRLEFTKDLGVGDGVVAARAIYYAPPVQTVVFYPFVGFEVGKPLRKPDTLFKQPVDLSGWTSSARLVAGAVTAFYLFQPKPTADNPYALSVNVAYTARKPFTDEPFVTTKTVDGKPAKVTELNQNVRHEIEAALVWNITKYAGLQAQYKYGSLPPVFKLADHQISVGITLKAKYGNARPALF